MTAAPAAMTAVETATTAVAAAMTAAPAATTAAPAATTAVTAATTAVPAATTAAPAATIAVAAAMTAAVAATTAVAAATTAAAAGVTAAAPAVRDLSTVTDIPDVREPPSHVLQSELLAFAVPPPHSAIYPPHRTSWMSIHGSPAAARRAAGGGGFDGLGQRRQGADPGLRQLEVDLAGRPPVPGEGGHHRAHLLVAGAGGRWEPGRSSSCRR